MGGIAPRKPLVTVQSRFSGRQPPSTVKRMPLTIELEYNGHKARVRPFKDYKLIISAAKGAFKDLHKVPNGRISLSARLDGQDDNTEVTSDIWSQVFLELKHAKVVLDSSSPPKPKLEDDDSGPQKPQMAEDIISASIRASGDLKQMASTVPKQPEEWVENQDSEDIIITVEYIREPRGMATDDRVLVMPNTRLVDLKAWIVSQDINYVDKEKATFWFEYNDSDLAGKRIVTDLDMEGDNERVMAWLTSIIPIRTMVRTNELS